MSIHHPIIAVTGSSGAGTSMVRTAFEHIFYRKKYHLLLLAVIVFIGMIVSI